MIDEIIDRLYGANSAKGKTGRVFDTLASLSSRNNIRSIGAILGSHQPQNTLEVGMAFGGSTIAFALHGKCLDQPGPHHVAIDPFQSTVWDGVGSLKLEEAGLSQYVELIEQPSSVVLPRLMAEGRRFGLIYVDGLHLFEDVFVDAFYCVRLLEDGGYLLFDDSTDKHVAKVLRFIDASLPNVRRQPETTLRQTIARYLGKRQLTIYRRIGAVAREWDAPFRDF